MKKLFTVIAASMLLMAGNLYARQQKSDVSFGTDATGIELIDGVLNPITSGGVSLGSSSLQFNNLYISGTATIEDISVTDDVSIGGDMSLTGKTVLASQTINVSTFTRNQSITSSYVIMQGTGTGIDTTGANASDGLHPVISTQGVTAGTYIILTNTSATKSVILSTGTDSCLIGDAVIVLDQNHVLNLLFNGSYWVVASSKTN